MARQLLGAMYLLLLLGAFARGGIYYVSPAGSDANPGTQDAPFRSIAKASGVAQAGDTVYLRAGKYAKPSGRPARDCQSSTSPLPVMRTKRPSSPMWFGRSTWTTGPISGSTV
jgi:hypothetical protein